MKRYRPSSSCLVALMIGISLLAQWPFLPLAGTAGAYEITIPSGFETSGAVWNTVQDLMYIVDDGGRILRMNITGAGQYWWNMSGDLEGITIANHSSNFVYVGIEYVSGQSAPALVEFNTSSGAATRTFYLTTPGATAADGLEAVEFVPNASHPQGGEFYVGCQANGDLYSFDLPIVTGGGDGQTFTHNHSIITSRGDVGALHWNETNKVMYASFDSNNKIQVLRLNGSLVREFDLPTLGGYGHDEGLAEDEAGHLIIGREDGTNEGLVTVIDNFLDYIGPHVLSVTLSDPSPTRAGNVTFTIGFDEPVNTAIDPVVRFGRVAPFTDHALNPLGWVNSTSWRGWADIDAATGEGTNNISIIGARDVIGNVMDPDTSRSFVIDTLAPNVAAVNLSRSQPVGPGQLGFSVTFDEPMDPVVPMFAYFGKTFPFLTHQINSTGWASGNKWTGMYTVSAADTDGPQNISVLGGADLAGNELTSFWNYTFELDTTPPTVHSVQVHGKGAALSFTIKFTEAMNATSPPAVTFGPASPYNHHPTAAVGWVEVTDWNCTVVPGTALDQGTNYLSISGGIDLVGNAMTPNQGRPFDIDSVGPTIISHSLADVLTPGNWQFNATFSEDMDLTALPTVTMGTGTPYDAIALKDVAWQGRSIEGNFLIDGASPNGINHVSIGGARDLEGNMMVTVTDITVLVDTSPPTSSIDDGLLPGLVNTLTFDVPFTAEDPTIGSGLQDVTLWYRQAGTSTYTGYGSAAPNTSLFAFTAPSDGVFEFYTLATDAAGLEEAPPATPDAIVTIDLDPPMVENVSFDRPGPYGKDVGVTITFTEDDVSLDNILVTFGSAFPFDTWPVKGDPAGPGVWHGTVQVDQAVESGPQWLAISGATDPAGNIMEKDTSTSFDVDTKLPQVTEFEHDGKEPLGNGTFNITIHFSEDMDITSPPRLTIRSTANNTALCVPEGSWTDARTWTGTCKVENSAGVGSYKVEISDGMDLVGNVMLPNIGPVIKVNTTLTGSGTGLPPCLPPEDDVDRNTGSAIPWNLWLIIAIAITLFLVVLVVKRFGRRRSG